MSNPLETNWSLIDLFANEETEIDDDAINDEVLLCFIRYRNQDLTRTLKAVRATNTFSRYHLER